MNQILNKWNKKVICKGEESTKELAEKNKDNLSRADLSRADLSGADLSGANLSGANLSGANFLGVNLSGADLSEIKNLPQQSQSNLHILKWQKSPLIGFKYLNKQTSPYRNFEYKIGRTYFCKDGNADERNLCGKGINLASLEWCLQDTNCDLSRTYGVFQFNPKDIIAIPYNSDGKFRVKKAKYLRNLTTKEIKQAMKLLYQTHNK